MRNREKASKFYEKAKHFCAYLENTEALQKPNFQQLALILAELYGLALILPDVESESESALNREIKSLHIDFGKYDTYWEVHNPFDCDDPVCGSLSDDFSDIYKELNIGINMYAKDINEAIWHWKWSFENHWSYHVVDALRALNQILQD